MGEEEPVVERELVQKLVQQLAQQLAQQLVQQLALELIATSTTIIIIEGIITLEVVVEDFTIGITDRIGALGTLDIIVTVVAAVSGPFTTTDIMSTKHLKLSSSRPHR